ncbi:MAG: hypothetical protein WCP55_03570 [Lentisphaerota bacterium]
MRIQFFDVDEVILRFGEGFIAFVNSELKTSFNIKTHTNYNLETSFQFPPGEFDRLFNEYISSSRIGDLEYYDDAVEYFNRTPDVVKIILTALPKTDVTEKERTRNLHKIKYHELIFDHKKSDYVEAYRPELIFEDRAENVEQYLTKRKYFGKICVPRRTYIHDFEMRMRHDPQIVFYDEMTELL